MRESRSIGRRFGTDLHAVRRFLARTGGCRRPPQRAEEALTAAEREEVSRGLAVGESYRTLGRRLGRAHTTIAREVARNGGPAHDGAGAADTAAWRRAERPKAAVLARRPAALAVIEAKLRQCRFPQQIAAWLLRAYPDDARVARDHLSLAVRAAPGRAATGADAPSLRSAPSRGAGPRLHIAERL